MSIFIHVSFKLSFLLLLFSFLVSLHVHASIRIFFIAGLIVIWKILKAYAWTLDTALLKSMWITNSMKLDYNCEPCSCSTSHDNPHLLCKSTNNSVSLYWRLLCVCMHAHIKGTTIAVASIIDSITCNVVLHIRLWIIDAMWKVLQ
jgi:hypothetical protein